MRAKWLLLALAAPAAGCGKTETRPGTLLCGDAGECTWSHVSGTGGTGTTDGAVTTGDAALADGALTDGATSVSVGGSLTVLAEVPGTVTTVRAPITGWTIAAVDDPSGATTVTDSTGVFSLGGLTPVADPFGAAVVAVRAIAPAATSLGAYARIAANATATEISTWTADRLLQSVSTGGGAPSSDLGHVAVRVVLASDPGAPVAGAIVTPSASATAFYDSDLTPGQLTPSGGGTGAKGFALVLNVPAGDTGSGSTVSLSVQVAGATSVVPATQTVRVFPNTVSWVWVRVVR